LPYISPAEREQANWRTLPEAVAHVARVSSCQPEDARSRISNALANGGLWPLCWADEQPLPSGSTGGFMVPNDFPPRKWSKAEIDEIDWEAGTTLDRSEYSPPKGRRRCLRIHRLAIEEWWPERKEEPAKKRAKPNPEQLDTWMLQKVEPGAKRDDTIADCCAATGATIRAAKAAWTRLPQDKRLRRGQKRLPRESEH
jgi:hypothetical protein